MTLIQIQERLISRVNSCHPGHRNRVARGACRQARRMLTAKGFDSDSIRVIIRDALDVATLERNAED